MAGIETSVPNELFTDSDDQAKLSISIRNLDVRFRVFEEQRLGLREIVGRGFRSRQTTQVHAISSLSLDVGIGEAVGVVGANGSGKSTLLRAIAGLQSKASGTVLVRGEVHLLGVSAALKPALSGYRNVLLGGLAIGMTRAEVSEAMDDVIAFSGLGSAMGRPMNTYSSGMRARLAFSIATLRTPEVLLVDEALAVGDREFRQRSLQRIRELRDQANTVMLVTHNLGEIRETCSRAIWMDQGHLRSDGAVEDVLSLYEASTP